MKKVITLLALCLISLAWSPHKALAQASCIGTATLNVTINTCVVGELVKASVRLQGCSNPSTGQMQVGTTFFNLIPLTQPYNRVPWNYAGTETITTKPANMIDWVLLQVYNAAGTSLIETKAALLLNNGNIVDIAYATNNTIEGVYFTNITANGNYRLVVRHRNHLAAMSSTDIVLPNNTSFSFSAPANVLGGVAQLATLSGGANALFAGDFNSDGVFSLQDFNGYFTAPPLNQYTDGDFNLSGSVTTADFNFYQPNSGVIGVSPIRY